ncbi:hypothetical protein [Streptomyces carpinensis]|uniref:Transposase n=1 Tax=Streptomyces carpinensis TaxID=66369 RepID=A0ABV1VXT7_9ACTN|nr:hypothetical protein [Streptomyces carpinensis]
MAGQFASARSEGWVLCQGEDGQERRAGYGRAVVFEERVHCAVEHRPKVPKRAHVRALVEKRAAGTALASADALVVGVVSGAAEPVQ